jgi:hypothetical protein
LSKCPMRPSRPRLSSSSSSPAGTSRVSQQDRGHRQQRPPTLARRTGSWATRARRWPAQRPEACPGSVAGKDRRLHHSPEVGSEPRRGLISSRRPATQSPKQHLGERRRKVRDVVPRVPVRPDPAGTARLDQVEPRRVAESRRQAQEVHAGREQVQVHAAAGRCVGDRRVYP